MNNKSKLFLMLATSLAVTPVLVATVDNVEAAAYKNPFKDLKPTYSYYDIIHQMRDKNIIYGYEDGTFKPTETLSRKHAAALIARSSAKLEATQPFVLPKDLSEKNSYYNDIKSLMQAGLLEADNKGNINPNKPLTRAEMARILVVAFGLTAEAADKQFSDVEANNTFKEFISTLSSTGITTGYEDGTFRPDGSLTRAHYAVFMFRAMNYVETGRVDGGEKPDSGSKDGEKEKPGTDNKDKDNGTKPSKPSVPSADKAKEGDGKVISEDEVAKYKPKNYDPAELEKQQIKVRVEQGHNFVHKFRYQDGFFFQNSIENEAKHFGMTSKEFLNIVNYTVKTGELYVGDRYALYFNHDTGWVHLTLRNE